jgi:hypothetical protein
MPQKYPQASKTLLEILKNPCQNINIPMQKLNHASKNKPTVSDSQGVLLMQ